MRTLPALVAALSLHAGCSASAPTQTPATEPPGPPTGEASPAPTGGGAGEAYYELREGAALGGLAEGDGRLLAFSAPGFPRAFIDALIARYGPPDEQGGRVLAWRGVAVPDVDGPTRLTLSLTRVVPLSGAEHFTVSVTAQASVGRDLLVPGTPSERAVRAFLDGLLAPNRTQ